MAKERIDKLLLERGLANSRTKAQAMVMAGIVLAGEKPVAKPSEVFEPGIAIRIKGESPHSRYVSRGGQKLEGALRAFAIDPFGLNCLDIGSSTGGFTDCLLQHGAAKVTAVDVGTNQLDWRLRNDLRVEVHERTNARELDAASFGARFDLIVIDVSFISVRNILSVAKRLLDADGKIIVLIKPQFEVGKGEVGKGGIVREPEKHERVVKEIIAFAENKGLVSAGIIESPILGAEGNKEFLAMFVKA